MDNDKNAVLKILLIMAAVVLLVLVGFWFYSKKSGDEPNIPVGDNSVNNQTEWELYENKKFGFSFRHPVNFRFESEEDYSEIGAINPGYWVRFIGSDNKTLLVVNVSLDANYLKKTAQGLMDEFFDYASKREPQPFDPIGESFVTRVNFNGVPYIKWGIVDGGYAVVTYTDKKSYEITLIKPPIYDKKSYQAIGYEKGVLSDSDFDKIMGSFTF